jgi:hypothetical protein
MPVRGSFGLFAISACPGLALLTFVPLAFASFAATCTTLRATCRFRRLYYRRFGRACKTDGMPACLLRDANTLPTIVVKHLLRFFWTTWLTAKTRFPIMAAGGV